MNRIAIVGPGAIGSLFGALLAREGSDVFLLDDNETRAAQRSSRGIRVVDGDSEWVAAVTSSTDAADFGIADTVMVCTKAYQTESAIRDMTPLVGADTILVSLQNGMGNAEQLVAVAPGRCVCGTTAMGAILGEAYAARWTGRGATQLAPFGDTPIAAAESVSALLTAADCENQVLADAQSMLWGKLIINAAINPVTAIHRITNGELLENGEIREQAYMAAREAAAVADALGIALPYDDVIAAVTRFCVKTAEYRSSMLQDVEHNRRTEIDAITGAIVREAACLDVPVPVSTKLLAAIKTISRED